MLKEFLKGLGMGLRTAWRLGYRKEPEPVVHYDNLICAIDDSGYSDDSVLFLFKQFIMVNDEDWRLNRALDLMREKRPHLIVKLYFQLGI